MDVKNLIRRNFSLLGTFKMEIVRVIIIAKARHAFSMAHTHMHTRTHTLTVSSFSSSWSLLCNTGGSPAAVSDPPLLVGLEGEGEVPKTTSSPSPLARVMLKLG